jgi:hypothetical protein
MSKVNGDVQQAIANTNAVYQAVLDIWAMTPIELKMYIASMFIISILLQYVKKSFLMQCSKKERIQKLWMISFPLAITLAILGTYIYSDKIHFGFFVLMGLTASTVSMGVHRVMVDYVWPAIKAVFEAVATRVMLMVRGKPKDD